MSTAPADVALDPGADVLRAGRSLFTLKVSTIAAAGAAAERSFDDPLRALGELYTSYARAIAQPVEEASPSAADFHRLGAVAAELLSATEPGPLAATLDRVHQGCRCIAVLLEARLRSSRSRSPRFSMRELMTLRKLWELGTDPIALETVIQLDGDVLTAASELAAPLAAGALLRPHHSLVLTAVQLWMDLASTMIALIGDMATLGRAFLGGE